MAGSKTLRMRWLAVGLVGVCICLASGDSSAHPRANFKGTRYEKRTGETQALASQQVSEVSKVSSEVEYVDGPLAPLYDFLIQRRLQRFCKLLRDAGLEEVIQDLGGSWTLFAPNDASFIFLPGGTLEELQRNPQLLRDFILYHFVVGDFPSSQIQNEMLVDSAQGSPLRFNVYGQIVTVSGAQILEPDLEFEMGRVYIIDRPLYPIPSMDIITYLQRNYKEIYRLVVDLGLVDYLSSGTFTFLVPDDEAFGYLSIELKDALKTNLSLAERILFNHILPGSVYVGGITDGMQWETVGGSLITFTVKRGLTFANDIPIVLPDVPLTNGVIHVTNRVILPEGVDADCHCKPSSDTGLKPNQVSGDSRPSFGQPQRPQSGQRATTTRPWQSNVRQTPRPIGGQPQSPTGTSTQPGQNPQDRPQGPISPGQTGSKPWSPSRTGQPVRPTPRPSHTTRSPYVTQPPSDDDINAVIGAGVQLDSGAKKPDQATRYPPLSPPAQRPSSHPTGLQSQGPQAQNCRKQGERVTAFNRNRPVCSESPASSGSGGDSYPGQGVTSEGHQSTGQTSGWSNRQRTPTPRYPTPQRGAYGGPTTRRPQTTRTYDWNQPRVTQPSVEQPHEGAGGDLAAPNQGQDFQTQRPGVQTTSWQQRNQIVQTTRQPYQPPRQPPQPPQRRTTVRPSYGQTSTSPQVPSNEQTFESRRQQPNCRRQGDRVTPFNQNLPVCSEFSPEGCQNSPLDPSDPRPLCPDSNAQDCKNPSDPYDPSDNRPLCQSPTFPSDCREFGQPTYNGDRRPLCAPSSVPQTGCKEPSAPYNPSDRRPVCHTTNTKVAPSQPAPGNDAPQECRRPDEVANPQDQRPMCPEEPKEDCRPFLERPQPGDRRPICKVNRQTSDPKPTKDADKVQKKPTQTTPRQSWQSPTRAPQSWQSTTRAPQSWQSTTRAPQSWQSTTRAPQSWQSTTRAPQSWQSTTRAPQSWQSTTRASQSWQSTTRAPQSWQSTTRAPQSWQSTTRAPQSWQSTRASQSWQSTTAAPQSWQGTTRAHQSWQTTRQPGGKQPQPGVGQTPGKPDDSSFQTHPQTGSHQTGAYPSGPQTGKVPSQPQPETDPSKPQSDIQPDVGDDIRPQTGPYPSQPQTGRYPSQSQSGRYPSQPQSGGRPLPPQNDRYPSQQQSGRYPSQPGSGTYPSQPGPGTHPSQPGTGTHPSQPGSGTHPSQPGSGTHPSQPQSGSYPSQPQTGSYPSQPQTPSHPLQPPSDSYPSQQSGHPQSGSYPTQPQTGSYPSQQPGRPQSGSYPTRPQTGSYPSQQPGRPQSGSYPSQPQTDSHTSQQPGSPHSGSYPSQPQTGTQPGSQTGSPRPVPGRGQFQPGRPTSGYPQRRPGSQTDSPVTTTSQPQYPGGIYQQRGTSGTTAPRRPVPSTTRVPISITGTSTPGEDTRRTLYEIVEDPALLIRGRPVHLTRIFSLFQKAGIQDILNEPGPITVFLPSDDAFALLPQGVVEQLEENPELLRQVLLYHVTKSEILPSAQGESYTVPSVEGNQLVITMLNGGRLIFISGAKAVAVTRANNGIFYVINQLLYPLPHHDIVGAIRSRPDLSTLAFLLPLSGLEEMLTGQTPYTFLAPTDNAFAQLPQPVYEELTRNTTALTEILLNHIIEGAHYGREFFTGGTFPSARGGKLKFQVVSYGYQVNDVNIKTPEIVTGTGVIHLVDQILLEEPDLKFFTSLENSVPGEDGVSGPQQPFVGQQQPGIPQPIPDRPRPGLDSRFPLSPQTGTGQPQVGGLQPPPGHQTPVGRVPASGQRTHGSQPTSPSQPQRPVSGGGAHQPGTGHQTPGQPTGSTTFGRPHQPSVQGHGRQPGQQTHGQSGHSTLGGQRVTSHGQRTHTTTFVDQRQPVGQTGGQISSVGYQGSFQSGGQATDVADLARTMGLNQFANWITNTGLLEKIHDGGVYTVFAPTDEAVDSLPQEMSYSIQSNPEQVKSILQYHIVPQRLNLNSITNEETASTLLQGKTIRFNVYQNSQPDCKQLVTASGTPLGEALATMGSIQVIPVTQVLYQPSGNLLKIIEASPILQQLNEAVKSSRLTWMLTGNGPMTIFAPSDTAFQSLTEEQRKTMIEDKQAFTELLKRHIVRGTFFSSGIQDDIEKKSENNKPMKLSLQEGILTVNSIPVTYSDITATNGVLHVIDHFL